MKQNFNVDEVLNTVEKLRIEIPNGKAKRKIDTVKNSIKQGYDKLYYEAYFDKRFQVCNYNKLLLDVGQLNKTEKFYLMCIHIPNLVINYYNSENKFATANSIINYLKNIARLEDGLFFKNVYIVSDYLFLIIDKNNIERIYKMIKNYKNSNNYDFCQLYFVKYSNESSKVNKNFKIAIEKISLVFSGKQESEPKVEKNDD
jgi:hypothetical protein